MPGLKCRGFTAQFGNIRVSEQRDRGPTTRSYWELGQPPVSLEGCAGNQDPRRRFMEEMELAIVSETKATIANARMTTTMAPTLL
jgi:hypothetical protein